MDFSLMVLEFLWQENHFLLVNTNSITLTKSEGILQNQENETFAWEKFWDAMYKLIQSEVKKA